MLSIWNASKTTAAAVQSGGKRGVDKQSDNKNFKYNVFWIEFWAHKPDLKFATTSVILV